MLSSVQTTPSHTNTVLSSVQATPSHPICVKLCLVQSRPHFYIISVYSCAYFSPGHTFTHCLRNTLLNSVQATPSLPVFLTLCKLSSVRVTPEHCLCKTMLSKYLKIAYDCDSLPFRRIVLSVLCIQ